MTDFQLVDPRGWEWDLQSVYSAYLNHFQVHNITWFDKTWGHLFSSFENFISFGWPVITVTDTSTGRAHVVTRTTSIGAFLKMIKTRYGEDIPMVDTMLRITPFEGHNRHLRTVADAASYKKIHNTLPSTILAAQKIRFRSGDVGLIQALWDKRDKTFLAMDFEWSERNRSSCLEWGYAAMRCSHLDALGVWPPIPAQNYRKGHYVVAEYTDAQHNRKLPNHPWEYAFGETQVVPKVKLPDIIQAIISSLAGPESETHSNQLVLVIHDKENAVEWMGELKIKLPNNVIIIDTATLERQIFARGTQGTMLDGQTGIPRKVGSMVSLRNALRSFQVDLGIAWHCSGNDAFANLLLLQLLLQPKGTEIPVRSTRMPLRPPVPTHIAPGIPTYLTPGSLANSPGRIPRASSIYLEMGVQETMNAVRSPGRGHAGVQRVSSFGSLTKRG